MSIPTSPTVTAWAFLSVRRLSAEAVEELILLRQTVGGLEVTVREILEFHGVSPSGSPPAQAVSSFRASDSTPEGEESIVVLDPVPDSNVFGEGHWISEILRDGERQSVDSAERRENREKIEGKEEDEDEYKTESKKGNEEKNKTDSEEEDEEEDETNSEEEGEEEDETDSEEEGEGEDETDSEEEGEEEEKIENGDEENEADNSETVKKFSQSSEPDVIVLDDSMSSVASPMSVEEVNQTIDLRT